MGKSTLYGGRAAVPLLLAALATLVMPGAPAVAAAPAPKAAQAVPEDVARGERLQLRWELQRTMSSGPHARTQGRFMLVNGDSRPLPPRGWSLYFNAMDSLATGDLPGRLVLEQVAGGLWRLRPAPGFAGLAPGQALDIPYQHTGVMIKLAHAPVGPYLVYDAAPDTGMAITDFQQLPVTRPEQLDRGPENGHALVTPADTWRRNARAALLPAAALSSVMPVLPTPLQLRSGTGKLALAGRPLVTAPATLVNEAALARSLFPAGLPASGGPALRLAIGTVPGQASPEAYRLAIAAGGGIDIVGNSAAGVAHGLQTLRDLMPLPGDAAPALPEVTVVDAPRFAYRGFMLDVARNFHGKETVFKWLDLMARFKLNKFHFHLTDDEGWRLEIAGLPELTSVGAVRGHSAKPGTYVQPAYGSGPDPSDAGGSGHYTRADYIEILRYAAARHIEVIPEIEMPGHARAAVQAMASRYHRLKAAGDREAAKYLLQDFDDRSVYKSPQYYTDHLMDPGLDSTYTFIGHVVDEIVALHREAGVPLRTLYMGGDEVPEGAWEKSPASLARMKKAGLATTAGLWDDFYDRVDGILKRHGLAMSGWEEIAARRVTVDGRSRLVANPRFTDRGFTAYVWNNTTGAEDLAYRLANGGYDIVLAPVTKMYMDMSANTNPEEAGVNWGAYVELDDVYGFIPLDYLKNAPAALRAGKEALSAEGRRRVRGLQATMFTETVRDPALIDHLVMPRLLAVAERAWAPDPAWATEADAAKAAALYADAWSGFVNALGQRVLPRLDLEKGSGAGVAYRIAPPGLLAEDGQVRANHVLPGLVLRYTSDGSTPTAASRPVAGPIAERGTIRVAAFDRNGRAGMVASVENR